jgi:hypothetical protein
MPGASGHGANAAMRRGFSSQLRAIAVYRSRVIARGGGEPATAGAENMSIQADGSTC